MVTRADHWDGVYAHQEETQVSWFEPKPAASVELLAAGRVDRHAPLIDVGAGASRLVDVLLAGGFTDVTALDVSGQGLAHARRRLGAEAGRVRWVVADLLDWVPDRRYGVWHDRAVFHFLTNPADRDRYRDVLDGALAPGALVVVGTFAEDGPQRCSGLSTARYSATGLAGELGLGLGIVASRRVEHRTPSGVVQPFMWVALRRSAHSSSHPGAGQVDEDGQHEQGGDGGDRAAVVEQDQLGLQ
jgi:hypothetical protein